MDSLPSGEELLASLGDFSEGCHSGRFCGTGDGAANCCTPGVDAAAAAGTLEDAATAAAAAAAAAAGWLAAFAIAAKAPAVK